MSTPIDKIGLPPRALGALRKAKLTTVEKAAAKSDKELLAIKGFGEGGLKIVQDFLAALKDLGPAPSLESAAAAVKAKHTMPPPTHAGPTLSGQRFELARFFFEQLAGKHQGSQFGSVVEYAWQLAVQFEQAGHRAQSGPLVLADGMEVLFNGERCILRTTIRPGETIPEDQRVAKAFLVKVP